jgi:hypothetical protein
MFTSGIRHSPGLTAVLIHPSAYKKGLSHRLAKRLPTYSVGSCPIRLKEGKLSLLEVASKAGEALTPASGRGHA